MNASAAIAAYRTNAAQTASKEQIVVMLAERLVTDIANATHAIEQRDIQQSHTLLVHAQDVLAALSDGLDVEMCPAGNELAALYDFVNNQLIEANTTKDATHLEPAATIAAQIADMFRTAITS